MGLRMYCSRRRVVSRMMNLSPHVALNLVRNETEISVCMCVNRWLVLVGRAATELRQLQQRPKDSQSGSCDDEDDEETETLEGLTCPALRARCKKKGARCSSLPRCSSTSPPTACSSTSSSTGLNLILTHCPSTALCGECTRRPLHLGVRHCHCSPPPLMTS
jgi:hypothetical protein